MTSEINPQPLVDSPVKRKRLSVQLGLVAALVGLAVLLGSAAAAVVLRERRLAVVPEDTALAAAAAWVERDVTSGDALAFHPGWSAAQSWRFEHAFAKKGVDFQRAWAHGHPIDLWDVDGFARLWVVGTHDRGADLRLPTKVLRHESLGRGTSLHLFSLPPSRTVFDLRQQLASAVVERREPDGNWRACTWQGDRHDCGDDWQDVYEGLNEVGNSRRRCMVVLPHRDDMPLRLTWRAPPAATSIAGRFGLRLWAVRYDEGSDLVMRVKVGERVLLEKAVARGDFTWHPWQAALRPEEAGRDISFEFTAKQIAWRQGCFDARLLGVAARE